MRIVDCEQGTPEWHEARCGKVTSSCFDKVLAKGRGSAESKTRKSYMMEVACERISGKVQDNFKSQWMERGNEIEDQARAQFTLETGKKVKQIGFCLMDGDEIGSSTDGLIGDDELLEIKCPKHTTHLEYLLDSSKLEKTYKAQVQGELFVTERKKAYLVSYHPDFPEGKDCVILEVERDEEFIENLQVELDKFLAELNDIIEKVEKES